MNPNRYDIRVHRPGLCSIKGFSDLYGSILDLTEIWTRLTETSQAVELEASRPYLVESKLTALNAEQGWDEINRDGTFSITANFQTNRNAIPDLRLISKLWFEYQRPCVSFFLNVADFVDYGQVPDRKWMLAKIQVLKYACYLAVKLAEEDVVWIYKSEHLSFDPVLEALEHRVV